MCCFTKPVISVNATRIFARVERAERQFLVYSMRLEAGEDLAMVLPLPVKHGSGDDAVNFINLKEYPEFFADLERGFPPPPDGRGARSHGGMISASLDVKPVPLTVVQVGDFEASFVPSVKDFSRLDARFRLPDAAWKKLPAYKDFGFAVFKLKPGLQQIHPMAFSCPRRDARWLFFPTVHIHDSQVHATAEFDHILYCQLNEGEPLKLSLPRLWSESPSHAQSFMKIAKTKGLLVADQHCYRRALNGNLPNRDTFAELES